MPLTDYTELIDAVEDWLVRPDLTDRIKDFIYLAEIRVAQDLNMPQDQAESTGSTVVDQELIFLPANLFQLESFTITDTSPVQQIEIVGWNEFEAAKYNLTDGRVRYGRVLGQLLYLADTPSSEQAYKIRYQAGTTHLSNSSTTSLLLTNHPNLLLYGSLAEAAPYIGDDQRIMPWAQLYQERLRAVKRINFRNRLGGGTLRMRPDSATP